MPWRRAWLPHPLQYSCLENPWTEEPDGLQSMVHKEPDTTKRLSTHSVNIIFRCTGKPHTHTNPQNSFIAWSKYWTHSISQVCLYLCKLSCVETQLHPCMHILSLATLMLSSYNADHYGPESLKYLLILCSPLQKQFFEPWSIRCIREGRN